MYCVRISDSSHNSVAHHIYRIPFHLHNIKCVVVYIVCEKYGYSFKNVLKSFWYRYCEYITITAWSNAGHSEKAVRGTDTGYKWAATVKGLLVWRTPLLPTVDQ